ncbi:fatty-acid peroxygenase [Actinoplanes philippinensis]|uniref:Fatty-acid peroxygenase n=1 Tax=Actinoplanes philippinensis TaxID=35752 RepID=A0A1I2K450_9ACTN|nr:cytochrome P450 [Actinoplanes philippinensis]GIE81485.1 fatty-acid peroxygenase [Actinoplanes philippinensis]SFF61872.1 fatty-acid peroxygenase [Actinoplanes philippinensis]
MADLDQTLAVALKGYAWLPDLRRRAGGGPVRTRVMGQPAVGICGTAAARFFYGTGNLERHTALPSLVVHTLFGAGGVQTLDGDAHRRRKPLFTSLLTGDGVDRLAKIAGEEFDAAADTWREGPPVRLFDETARILARAVSRWAGVPLEDREILALARDCVAMVDGFATVGPRTARALVARRLQERRLSKIIAGVRAKPRTTSALSAVAHHSDDGSPVDPRTAAVELLNILRPTIAVAWYVAFAAHAMDMWPRHQSRMRAGDDDYTLAFTHEVRRFYPFAPFLGGRATRDLFFQGEPIPAGTLVLLDVYGHHHDPELWIDPYRFDPDRFLGREPGEFDLIPQGGGDPRTGHRCPGEKITIALLGTLSRRLAELDHYLPPQDTGITLSRIPALPRDRIRLVVPEHHRPARATPAVSASRSPVSGGS